MTEPPLAPWRRIICSILYAGMIGVGIYLIEDWFVVESDGTRGARKVIGLVGLMGMSFAGFGLYLMWTDIVVPLFRKQP